MYKPSTLCRILLLSDCKILLQHKSGVVGGIGIYWKDGDEYPTMIDTMTRRTVTYDSFKQFDKDVNELFKNGYFLGTVTMKDGTKRHFKKSSRWKIHKLIKECIKDE